MTRIIAIALGSILLWAAGTLFFDFVHYLLHRMLRSRSRLVRSLAWPHSVHHRWLDARLAIHWELQNHNVFCHLVPEYLTQVAFTAAMLPLLPAAPVAGCVLLQTAVFVGLLCFRGLDINHRPIAVLDAHRPSIFAPPAYHALHHVHPDSNFSAYSKLVDLLVGGGCAINGRRFHVSPAEHPACERLCAHLRGRGAEILATKPGEPRREVRGDDVLVLSPDTAAGATMIESFLAACAHDQLPPEVWDLRAEVDPRETRFYERDPRVVYRHSAPRSVESAEAFADRALFWFVRGLHRVPATWRQAPAMRRRLRRTAARPPAGAPSVRSRKELTASVRAASPVALR